MAIVDWSTDAKQNVALGSFRLNGEFGAMFAELMAQIKIKFDGVDTAVEAAGDGVGAVNATIGDWTDTTETTTVKAAIEALRPEPDADTEQGE